MYVVLTRRGRRWTKDFADPGACLNSAVNRYCAGVENLNHLPPIARWRVMTDRGFRLADLDRPPAGWRRPPRFDVSAGNR